MCQYSFLMHVLYDSYLYSFFPSFIKIVMMMIYRMSVLLNDN